MVARTPPKQIKKMVAPLNPTQLRETLCKVDKCMARLQELQYTVAGGAKVISGVSLSPRSTRGYLRTSLRCKQESLRIKNGNPRKSSPGKFPTNTEEWRRMSLPAMLLGETVGEIIQASQFARDIVSTMAPKTRKSTSTTADPKTPVSLRRHINPENSELRQRRNREKQITFQSNRSESKSPTLKRAKSRINFKISPPPKTRENHNHKEKYIANRVSPKHKPWAKKTVLFPNPLFHSSSPPKYFGRTNSPVIGKNRENPHKFLIKSAEKSPAKFQVRLKSPPGKTRQTPHKFLNRSSPEKSPARSPGKFQVKIKSPPLIGKNRHTPHKFLIKSPPAKSPAKFPVKTKSPPRVLISPAGRSRKGFLTAEKLRRSFSPSRLANRLVSPLKSRRKSVQSSCEGMKMMMSGLKQRPSAMEMEFSGRGI
ncbi:hypothetical protein LguiA_026256 [Lonicera macranthoides]